MATVESIIYDLSVKRKKIVTQKYIPQDTIVIIDFFNIYCHIINFDKHKTFTKETFFICMNRIYEKFKHHQVFVISKVIFEVETEYILEILQRMKNIKYIMVEDRHPIKSHNRERDDFACILYNKMFKNSVIITNDRFTNLNSIITTIKPLALHMISDEKTVDIDEKTLNDELIPKLKNIKIDRVGFSVH